jgi:hypothetical protein
MPLDRLQRSEQTQEFGSLMSDAAAGTTALGISAETDQRVAATARIQGGLALAVGVEVGYFDPVAAGRELDRLQLRGEDLQTLGLQSQPLLPDRISALINGRFDPPGYRPGFLATDAAQITFRSVLLPIARAWQQPDRVPAFLANLGHDSNTDEVQVAIEAFGMLDCAAAALNAASQWTLDSSGIGSDFDAWLRFECSMLFQVQVNTSDPEVRRRLAAIAAGLVRETEQRAQQIALEQTSDKQAQASLFAAIALRSEQWRADLARIVERFDAAVAQFATS